MAGEVSVFTPMGAGGGTQDDTGFDPLRFVQTIQALKQQKQQSARQGLQQMTQLAEQGLLGPEAAGDMEKMFKEAFPEMSGKAQPQPTGQPLPQGITPQSVSSLGKSVGGSSSGAQSATPVSDQAAQKAPPGGAMPDAMKPGSGQFEEFLTRSREHARQLNLTQNQTLQYQQIVGQKQMEAAQGDNKAVGFLQRLGLIPFNESLEMWNDPAHGQEVRTAAFDRALGRETADEKERRIQTAAQDAVLKGKFNTAKEARDFFENPTSTVKPNMSAEDFMRQASALHEMIDAGVPPSNAVQAARAAGTGANPWSMVPEGFKSIAQQGMDLKKQELGLEEQRIGVAREGVGVEREKLQLEMQQSKAAANRVLLELDQERNKALKDKLSFLVDAAYRGVALPEGMQETLMNELASTLGSRLEKDTSWVRSALSWILPDFVMAPEHYSIVPNTTPEDQSTVQEGIGTPQAGSQSTVQPFTSRSIGGVGAGMRRTTQGR